MENTRQFVSSFRPADSIFRMSNRDDDEIVTPGLMKLARATGVLNLSGKGLCWVPDAVWCIEDLTLEEIRNLERNVASRTENSTHRWWEFEPLTYLDLSSNCLTQLPCRINSLCSLSTFYVQDNKLEELPEEFGNLRCIQNLNLSKNNFRYLPHVLFRLRDLQVLLVAHNQLEIVHEGISDFVMLQQLDLSHNNVSSLPPGMGYLIRLTQLDLSHNKLEEIPPDLVNLRVLQEFKLDYNELASLPPMGELRRLKIFSAVHNQLTCLPNLSGCEDLRELHLECNQIKEMSADCIEGLARLRVFNLRDNQLCNLPAEVSHLLHLQQFDVRNNLLSSLPASLAVLPHLLNIQLEGNPLEDIRKDILCSGTVRVLRFLRQKLHEEGGPEWGASPSSDVRDIKFPDRYLMQKSNALNLSQNALSNVPHEVFMEADAAEISVVDLSKNKLTELPEGLLVLTKRLRELNLSCNLLKSVPPTLGACHNLQFLHLKKNGLTSLPEELAELERLRELNIARNKFQELPSCIFGMVGLEILDAHDNQVCSINTDGLSKLKYLTILNLRNNNITFVPPELGYLSQLRSLELSGNRFRHPRYSILEKGTAEILSYLRNRMPL